MNVSAPNWTTVFQLACAGVLNFATESSYAQDMAGAIPAGWVTLGAHTPHALPPTSGYSVEPSAATGAAPNFRYRIEAQADGRFIQLAYLRIKAPGPTDNCYVKFDIYENKAYLGPAESQSGGLGSSATLSDPFCSLPLASARLLPDATGLTIELTLQFAAGFTGTKSNEMTTFDRAGRWAGPTVGSWTSGGAPPSAISYTATPVTPGNPARSIFLFTFDGGANAGGGLVLINSALDGAQSCFVSIDRRSNSVALALDDGISWGGALLGQSVLLENSFCRIRVASSSMILNGSIWEARIDLEIFAPLSGAQNVYTAAFDIDGTLAGQGWVTHAPYTAHPAPALMSLSVTPTASAQTSQLFEYRLQTNTVGLFAKGGWLLFNPTLTTANACVVGFDVFTRRITLNPHLSGAYGIAGTASTLSGTECSVDLSASAFVLDFQSATLRIQILFGSGFSGVKNNYATAWDRAGRFFDWTQLGTWGQGAGVLTVDPEEQFNVTVNSPVSMTARCDGAVLPNGVQWQILHGQGSATISNAAANPITVTASGIPAGGYIAVQATTNCGGVQRSSIGYLYMNYFSSPDGPNVTPNSGSGGQ